MNRPKKAEQRDRELISAVEQHGGRLLSSIRGKVRDGAEADEVFQDVLQELIETYDFGTAIESLGAWLVTVAQNKILDRFRRRKTRVEYERSALVTSDGESTSRDRPDECWTRAWIRTAIVNAIETLPQEQREVFVKHELEGKSFEEIAAETGVGVNTLLSRKRYAVIQLREYLKEVYDELDE